MAGRLTLLVGSPRVAPGLLTRAAWQALDAADAVLARDADEPLADAVAESGMPVTHLGERRPAGRWPARLMDRAADGRRRLGVVGRRRPRAHRRDRLGGVPARARRPRSRSSSASWDVPGSRLLDLVAVMDRLRSPGGCPWDAEQTHESLVQYLIEEAHEAVEAIESGDRDHIREELGDVLLQVVFHSRVAQEHPTEPFDIDDVAGAIVEKLVRRHPHVFADGDASTPAEVEQAWEQIKAGRSGPPRPPHGGGEDGHQGLLHGIPRSLPSLLAAEKVLARWERTGGDLPHWLRTRATTWVPRCSPWWPVPGSRASRRMPCCARP